MLNKIISKYKIPFIGALIFALVLGSCSSSDDLDPEAPIDPPEVPVNKSSGFVVVGTTTNETALVKYYEEIPTGTIDISDGKDFLQFFPTSLYDNALYLARPDESPGFAKMVVNSEGEVVEEGIIPTVEGSSFRIQVKDSETGVFQDRATPNTITVFNPETLEVTGTIDMSAGFVPGDVDQRYQRFVFRGNDIFAPIRGNDGAIFPSFILHQSNLSSEAFVGDTQRDGNGVSPINTLNNFGQNLIDPMGNLYIGDAGNFEGAGIPARINKIPAGSNEIDPGYIFEPATVLDPTNVFLPTFSGFNVLSDGTAFARVNSETPQAAIDIVLAAGGVQNLSPDQIQQIFGILFTAESSLWCALDLEAKTVTPIDGIPAVGIFAGGQMFVHNGEVYLPVTTTTENAYYKWNPSTGATSKAFEVTGADISGVYNIANNN